MVQKPPGVQRRIDAGAVAAGRRLFDGDCGRPAAVAAPASAGGHVAAGQHAHACRCRRRPTRRTSARICIGG
jgi:hypothetical protein